MYNGELRDRSQMTSAKRGDGGVSQKLTKVDKEGGRGFCQKLMSANYHIFMTKINDICSLGAVFAFFERAPKLTKKWTFYIILDKNIFFFQFSFVVLPKSMFYLTKIVVFFLSLRTYISINSCWKADVSQGGRGVFFVKKLTEADKWGGGVKIDQILTDVICERSLINEADNPAVNEVLWCTCTKNVRFCCGASWAKGNVVMISDYVSDIET